VTNCSFLNNTAGDKGGGLYCDSTAEIFISYTLFSNNAADVVGGGIFGYSEGVITLDDCIVSENSAGISGGGIYISNSSSSTQPTRLVAQTTTIRDNLALSFLDGYVGFYSEAELTCCDIDMAQWGGEGTIILYNEDCDPIATEEKTWGGIKTLYR
jgi:predicted outer membrane repeat protein